MSGFRIGLACVALTLVAVPALRGEATEGETGDPETEALIERILELRDELDGLLENLSPELAAEVERRWRDSKTREVEAQLAGTEAEEGAEPDVAVTEPTSSTAPPVPSPEPPPAESAPLEVETLPVEVLLVETPPVEPVSPSPAEEVAVEEVPEEVPACGTLHVLDRNGDGVVDGSDRDWRYLYLLPGGQDVVAEGALERDAVESLFDLGIRSLSVGLREYGTDPKTFGDIVLGDTVRLLLIEKQQGHDSGALVVDASRLARSGEIRLVDSVTGEPLDGLRLFRPGVALELADGTRTPVPCD